MKMHFASRRFKGEAFDPEDCVHDELVMLVDVDRCIGCGACAMACEIEHEGALGAGEAMRPIVAAGAAHVSRMVVLPLTCRHCENPCEYQNDYNFWAMCPSGKQKNAITSFCDSCVSRLAVDQYPACAMRCTMKTIYFGRPPEMALVLADKRLREKGDVQFEG